MKRTFFLGVTCLSLLLSCQLTTGSIVDKSETQRPPSPTPQQLVPPQTDEAPIVASQPPPTPTPTTGTPPISQSSPLATPTENTVHLESTATDNETQPAGRRAVFPNTIIVYQQHRQQWTFYHTGRIVAGDGTEWLVSNTAVQPLFALVESPDFWSLDENYAAEDGQSSDQSLRILTVYQEGKIKEITVTAASVNLPEYLQQILQIIDHLISQ